MAEFWQLRQVPTITTGDTSPPGPLYWNAPAHEALDRMRRASRRGTGCHLTAEMIRSLGLTSIGQIWTEENPFKNPEADNG